MIDMKPINKNHGYELGCFIHIIAVMYVIVPPGHVPHALSAGHQESRETTRRIQQPATRPPFILVRYAVRIVDALGFVGRFVSCLSLHLSWLGL
jgi:hypothetical protein